MQGAEDSASVTDAMNALVIVTILGFVAFFEAGVGAIPWLIGAEIFAEGPRATAMGFAAGANWIGNGVIGVAVPPLISLISHWVFVPFCAVLVGGFVFTFLFVPETRGRSLVDIQAAFKDRSKLTVKSRLSDDENIGMAKASYTSPTPVTQL